MYYFQKLIFSNGLISVKYFNLSWYSAAQVKRKNGIFPNVWICTRFLPYVSLFSLHKCWKMLKIAQKIHYKLQILLRPWSGTYGVPTYDRFLNPRSNYSPSLEHSPSPPPWLKKTKERKKRTFPPFWVHCQKNFIQTEHYFFSAWCNAAYLVTLHPSDCSRLHSTNADLLHLIQLSWFSRAKTENFVIVSPNLEAPQSLSLIHISEPTRPY